MNNMMTVVRFTFATRFKSKTFIVTTLIFALLLSVLINLPSIVAAFSSGGPEKVGAIDTPSGVARKLQAYFETQQQANVQIVVVSASDSPERERELIDMLNAGEIKGYLQFSEDPASGFPKAAYKTKRMASSGLVSKLKTALREIKTETVVKDFGLTAEQLARLNAPVALDVVQIQNDAGAGKTEAEMAAAYVLVYILLILLYMGVLGFGNIVATEITAEKSSRVMEVLVSSISPLKQMFGKIIGICLLGLFQIAVLIAVGAANLALPGNAERLKEINLRLNELPWWLLIYFILFYLLGYFIYATVFAAVGSLVSRTEDVGQAIMPVTLLIVAGFMIAVYGLQDPNAPFVVAMSFVPFFTPLIMFLRLGMSNPAVWEVWLSIALTFAAVYLLGWLTAKIYRVGVLMYGKRPTPKELWRAMKEMNVW